MYKGPISKLLKTCIIITLALSLVLPQALIYAKNDDVSNSTKIVQIQTCVKGSVTDPSTGEKLNNATVKYINNEDNTTNSIATDKNGEFLINDLKVCDYDWYIQYKGYKTASYIAYPVFVGETSLSFEISKSTEIIDTFKRQTQIEGVPGPALSFSESIKSGLTNDMVLQQIFNTAGPTPYVPTSMKVLRRATNTIETVPLETYIYRVIPGEISDKMGGKTVEQIKEIYRTQAIAARGYATYSKYFDRKHGSTYDVCDSTCCQVYNPNDTNSYATTATNDTAKQIPALVSGSPYNWDIKYVHAFFFNSCSGYTKSCKEVWGTDISYLVSVSCPYDPTKYAIPKTDGHGVGLCQDGTAGYVTNGLLHTDIIQHYYTGASVLTGTYN